MKKFLCFKKSGAIIFLCLFLFFSTPFSASAIGVTPTSTGGFISPIPVGPSVTSGITIIPVPCTILFALDFSSGIPKPIPTGTPAIYTIQLNGFPPIPTPIIVPLTPPYAKPNFLPPISKNLIPRIGVTSLNLGVAGSCSTPTPPFVLLGLVSFMHGSYYEQPFSK